MKNFTHHSLELSYGMRRKDLLIVLSLHFILYAEIWWWHYYLWTIGWCVCWRSFESSSNAEKSFVRLWMFARFWKLKTQKKTRVWNSNKFQGCFEVSYDAEVSMAPLLQDAPILQQSNRSLSGPNVSVVHIFYKNNYFRSQKKNEIIGFTEFLCELSLIKLFLKNLKIFM